MLNLYWPRQPEASMTLLILRAYSPSQAVQSIGATADLIIRYSGWTILYN